MAGNKYVAENAGLLTEVAGQQTSAGVADADKIVALDASGKLDVTLLPAGIGQDSLVVTTSEALANGDFVNIHNVTGNARARKADASTSGKEAHGFVLAAYGSGASATVLFEGTNTAVSGMTSGPVYLSTTPGLATNTAPSAAGNVVQRVGFAIGATQVNFQSNDPILKA